MNRIEQAIKNTREIPHIYAIDGYPLIPFYSDKDGMWYLYTLYHLEQIANLMGTLYD